MLFTGHSEHSIDAKLRLSIPSKFRTKDPATTRVWVSVPWPVGVIRLYPADTFERMSAVERDTLTPSPDLADLEAELFGLAEQLEEDAAGRVRLPKLHLDMTGLGGQVVVVGARNRLEVRDLATWQAGALARFHRLPELAARIDARRAGPPSGPSVGTS